MHERKTLNNYSKAPALIRVSLIYVRRFLSFHIASLDFDNERALKYTRATLNIAGPLETKIKC